MLETGDPCRIPQIDVDENELSWLRARKLVEVKELGVKKISEAKLELARVRGTIRNDSDPLRRLIRPVDAHARYLLRASCTGKRRKTPAKARYS
jgi:hypothetical protein